jgi:hypothetical protein
MSVKTMRSVLAGLSLLALIAQPATAAEPGSWVLLALDVNMGAVHPRDTLPNLPTPAAGEGLPTFQTRAECQRALRQTIRFYVYPGHVHATGAFGLYLCTDYRTWAHE